MFEIFLNKEMIESKCKLINHYCIWEQEENTNTND